MADYKRMVSYMYQYENGVKRKNVGYARIEAKNGQCKITLHMQLLGQLDSIFPTYLIQRDGNNLDLIYLGDTVLKNQIMDSKLYANEANIMDTGHSLSQMGGMLLFLNDNIFFATEWDDKPIVAKEVLEALKPKKQKDRSIRTEVEDSTPTERYYEKDKVVEQAQVVEVMGNTVKQSSPEEWNISQEITSNVKESDILEDMHASQQELDEMADYQEGSNSGIPSEAEVYTENTAYDQKLSEASERVDFAEISKEEDLHEFEPSKEVFDFYSAQNLSLEEELKIPKYKLPRGWKTVERLHRTPINDINLTEQVLEAAGFESPEAMQANAEKYAQDQHLEIQQNLFGELLEQLQESGAFEEAPAQFEDEVMDSLYGDEANSAYDGMNDDMLREYFGEDNFYEYDPGTLDPLMGTSPELEESPSDTLQDELLMPQMPDTFAMPETPEEPEELGFPQEPEMPEESFTTPVAEPEQEMGEEPLPGEEEMIREPEVMPRPEGEEGTEQPEHPTAKNFFDHYPRIYPFEDNEIIFCVKIEPKDIGMLPKEIWPLSNNSFLMHGFYCYHHLIFAKLKNRYGTYYILGIPGIYHNRERFMAKMFGFENFKSIRKRDLRQGDFGYWYLPINF